MNIRKAIEDDAEQIKDLISGLSHYYLSDNEQDLPIWLSSTLELNNVRDRLNNNFFEHLVCEVNGDIVGYISIKDKNHLYHLFVSEKHQRKGIARKLWKNIINVCAS